ncbi:MAG TPA: M23 family metallopeptidase, partial [Steroidobacteraceae bacterium]
MPIRPPSARMRLRPLYGDKPQSFHVGHSMYGNNVRTESRGKPRPHQGWDLSAPMGTKVYAIARGICKHAQWVDHKNAYDWGANYGLHVLLEIENGNREGVNIPFVKSKRIYAFYAHLSAVYVFNGQEVLAGDVIGRTGRSGAGAKKLPIDQAHLHFEIRTIPESRPGIAYHVDPTFLFPIPQAENRR